MAQSAHTRTLISDVSLNRPRGKVIYRIVLTLVVLGFTVAFVGPLYFLFTDGLKSTTEAIATPPTLYPHQASLGNYGQAWNRLDVGRMLWNSVYYAVGALALQLVFDVAAAYSLRLRTAVHAAFLVLAALYLCISKAGVQCPKDLIRELAIVLALLPFAFAAPPEFARIDPRARLLSERRRGS